MTAPRDPNPTVDFIDVYCSYYQDLFPEVRSFENFKDLHVGSLSELKRKSLPEMAKVVGLEDGQSLHHFLRNSPWSAAEFRNRRLRRRAWVEYGLKQSKDELGWADFRLTHYEDICKWWEIVCSAYLLVSLYSEQLNKNQRMSQQVFSEHERWDNKSGWKNLLNNLRLIMQPFIYFNLIKS